MTHEGGSIGGGPTSGNTKKEIRRVNQLRLEQSLNIFPGKTGIPALDKRRANRQ